MKIWVILATAAFALAQTPPAQQAKSVVGEVTSVDSSGKQLSVKTDNASSYAVKVQDGTTFLRMTPGEKDIKKATPIVFADVAVGDRVAARGPISEEDKTVAAKTIIVMTKTDLAQKHEQDRQGWQKGVVGIVSAVNPDTKEVTITTRGANPKPVIVDISSNPNFLRYAPGSYRFDEAKAGTFADIKLGDNLRARGEKNDDGSRIKADQVLSGSFLTLAGTVISVDAANGIVKVTDLATKKLVEVKTTGETMARKIPEMMATMMARRMNGTTAAPGGGPAGGPGGAGAPQGGTPAGGPPQGMRSPGAEGRPSGAGMAGGPGGPGGPGGSGMGGGRGGNFDLQTALERMPPMALTDLKPGDALIISSTKGATAATVTAITLVAGVEPFLASAPRTAGQVNLGSWSFDGGVPAQ